jgi:hypothetical protein
VKTRRTLFSAAAAAAAAILWLAPAACSAEVWSPNPAEAVFEGPDYSGKDDPRCVLLIVGARGGAFSGQGVVFSKEPAKGPEAKVSDLKSKPRSESDGALLQGKDGKAVIPASAVELRSALPTGVNGIHSMPAGVTGIFDALSPTPRMSGTVHPVWVTVNVPADAPAGEHEGAKGQGGLQETSAEFANGPWQERSARLFAAAAEVAGALGGK